MIESGRPIRNRLCSNHFLSSPNELNPHKKNVFAHFANCVCAFICSHTGLPFWPLPPGKIYRHNPSSSCVCDGSRGAYTPDNVLPTTTTKKNRSESYLTVGSTSRSVWIKLRKRGNSIPFSRTFFISCCCRRCRCQPARLFLLNVWKRSPFFALDIHEYTT